MGTTLSASRRKTSALYASSQFFAGRLILSGMIAFGAYISGSRQWPLIWFLMMLASILGQVFAAVVMRRDGRKGDIAFWLRWSLSFFDTAMYSRAASAISHNPGAASVPFGVTVILLTMLYVLMQFYMQPALLTLLIAPCFLGLVYCLGGNVLNAGVLHHPKLLYLPFTGALFTLYFFVEARSHLAKARRALTKSRSEAEERASDAQAANQVKSEFLATMGHEIRTPLNGVLGIAQVMSVDELSDLQRERLSIIRTSGESLLAILNDLLDISKIEAGKLELEIVEFVLSDIAKGAHAAFSAAANAKDIGFRLSIEDSALGNYRGDPARLRQVFYNLISNAVKFTLDGEVCVTIAHADERLCIEVRDTGVGIPADRQGALFDKFVQADASTTRKYGGTGLGLAISNQLVMAMGGVLSVQSAEGVGSTFTASIPMPKFATTEAAPAQVATPVDLDGIEGGLRVLVAEDNATNQMVIKLMLNQIGVEPVIVDNGRAAVNASGLQDWDVILMDVQMPEMDGVAATREIRQRQFVEGAPRTPILALTANAMTHQSAEYIAAGMDGLISKPIAASELFSALEAVLAGADQPCAVEAA